MLERFRDFWNGLLSPFVSLLIKLGITPNQVTVASTIGVVTCALVFFPSDHLAIATFSIWACAFGDLVDGQLARRTGKTSVFGSFLDSTLDRIADAAIFAGIAYYFMRDDARTTWLDPSIYVGLAIASIALGATVSYARSKAEGLGFTAQVGIAERADRITVVLVGSGLSALFGWAWAFEVALWFVAIGSFITVLMRMTTVYKQATAASQP